MIDAAQGEVTRTLTAGTQPSDVAVSADGSSALVTNYGDLTTAGTVSVLPIS